MATIEFTRDADRDLIDIYLFGVEHFGAAQAERYLDMINAKIERVAAHPDFATDYGFVLPALRRSEVVSRAVHFRATMTGILVLRVLHGRTDAARHLT